MGKKLLSQFFLILSISIKNEPLLNFTSTVSGDLIERISPISEHDLNSKIDKISSLDILQLTNKYFSKPFLSISGNKDICLEISKRWKQNF